MSKNLTAQFVFTHLGYKLNKLIDQGEFIDLDDIFTMAEEETLISWLEAKVDLPFWDDDDKKIMSVEFASMANAIDHERKFGVSKNGICLLIAYCLNFIDYPPSRTLADL